MKEKLSQFFVAAGTSLQSCHLATIRRYTQTHAANNYSLLAVFVAAGIVYRAVA
jgi:hypothetical protein